MHAADRFGDYGLVGAMLFSSDAGELKVDSFLLSCRALERGIEHRMLARLGAIAEERGCSRVEVPFISTGRNQPARDFLDRLVAAGRATGAPDGEGLILTMDASVASRLTFEPAPAGSKPATARETDRATPTGRAWPHRITPTSSIC